MKTSFVYILECSDNSYYTGLTSNLEKRLLQHHTGQFINSYTFRRLPVELVYLKRFTYINRAILFEKQLKEWTRKKKRALIQSNWKGLEDYAKCKNETSHTNFKKKGFVPITIGTAQPDDDRNTQPYSW